MNHVNNGFKGYQHYEFNVIKDLATTKQDQQEGNDKPAQSIDSKESGSKTNLLDLNSKNGGFADDDEILLNIDTELQQQNQQHSPDYNKIFETSKLKTEQMDDDLLNL